MAEKRRGHLGQLVLLIGIACVINLFGPASTEQVNFVAQPSHGSSRLKQTLKKDSTAESAVALGTTLILTQPEPAMAYEAGFSGDVIFQLGAIAVIIIGAFGLMFFPGEDQEDDWQKRLREDMDESSRTRMVEERDDDDEMKGPMSR
eukprot:TRINITY_DN97538_c0_g1_i1.p1 TRINITY_DN97538_c0_g1~~TRINITY_DN97538_c0_g1_i1.p1  ORF type:complete len:163 (-),score=22.43 TRINITY_DN97538_c0_g1_i1:125-565(-)